MSGAIGEDAEDAPADAAEPVDADPDRHAASSELCSIEPRTARRARRRGGRSPSPCRTRRASWTSARPSTIVARQSNVRGVTRAGHVRGDDGLVLVTEHAASTGPSRRRAHDLVDRVAGHRPLVPADQVDDRAVGDRHVHRVARDASRELGQQAGEHRRRARLLRDDVLGRRAAAALVLGRHVGQPVLARVGVDGREDRPLDAEGFVEDLHDRRERSARSTRRWRRCGARAESAVVVDAEDDRHVRRLERRRAAGSPAARRRPGGASTSARVRPREVASRTVSTPSSPQFGTGGWFFPVSSGMRRPAT